MQQYTTEWAKQYLRGHPDINSICQHKDLTISVNECKYMEILFDKYWQPSMFGHWECNRLPQMLEHPKGWQNSLVTRRNKMEKIDMKHKTNKIVKPRFSQDLEQAKKVKTLFLNYFDGCYGIASVENTSNTFAMGVCKLDYKNNTLTVHLRRPGLLIGKGGCIIDALAKHLHCKIDIVEVNLLK